MKNIRTILFAAIAMLMLSCLQVRGQENEPDSNTFLIIESLNDSIDLHSNFYDITDSLSELFPMSAFYESWDTEGIHYPKVDFSKKEDTTLLVLCDEKTNFFCMPRKDKINSDYGFRRRRFHYGIDIDLNIGDTIRSAFDGMVRIAKYHKGYGNVVVVRHFNGLETIYGHLSYTKVQINQTVKAGEMLGLGGNTGRSTGPHLHFEIRYLGTPMNPRKVIDFDKFKLLSDTLLITKHTFESPLKSIKGGKGTKTTTQNYKGGGTYYTVKSGDTLGHIAAKYGTSVSTLCKLNGLTSKSILRIGQRIRIR
jgi:murein DD-endopeptidase MepM/ murein hydrolase activator NlpD